MTIRHLKIFITVAETGKMSAAASKFYISQPAVSQAIKEMENYYGLLLFERVSKKLYITESGKKLLKYAKRVITEFDALEEEMIAEKQIKRIKIGVTITVGTNFISDVIDKLNKYDPEIETVIYMNNTKNIEEMLLSSEIDIAVVEGNIKNKDLIVIPEVDDFLVLACSPSHTFANKDIIKYSELEDAYFVMREKGSGTRELFENFMEKNNLKIKTSWEVNCPSAIKNIILRNNCVAVVSARILEKEIKEGSLYVIKNSSNEWKRDFSVVYHKNKRLNKSAKKLIEIVKSNSEMNILDNIKTGKLIPDK